MKKAKNTESQREARLITNFPVSRSLIYAVEKTDQGEYKSIMKGSINGQDNFILFHSIFERVFREPVPAFTKVILLFTLFEEALATLAITNEKDVDELKWLIPVIQRDVEERTSEKMEQGEDVSDDTAKFFFSLAVELVDYIHKIGVTEYKTKQFSKELDGEDNDKDGDEDSKTEE